MTNKMMKYLGIGILGASIFFSGGCGALERNREISEFLNGDRSGRVGQFQKDEGASRIHRDYKTGVGLDRSGMSEAEAERYQENQINERIAYEAEGQRELRLTREHFDRQGDAWKGYWRKINKMGSEPSGFW